MEENISHCMNWIRQNEAELIRLYEGKFILIKDKKVRSVSDSKQEIMKRGVARFGRGNFVTYFVKRDDMLNRILEDNDNLLGDLKNLL